MSPFDYELGVSQGRIAPVNATPTEGTQLFCLGTDRLPAPAFDFAFGDAATLTQSIDFAGINLLRATCRIRQPADVPRQTVLPAGSSLQHGGLFPTTAYHSRTEPGIGAGASRVRYWADATGTVAPAIRVAHVDDGSANRGLAIATIGNDITAFLAKTAGAISSTAADVARAVNLDLVASALVTAVADGVGIAATAAFTTLSLDASEELDAVVTVADFFTDAHVGRVLRTSGSAFPANNADRLIVGRIDARRALLTSVIVTDNTALSPGLSLLLVGARWAAELLIDGGLIAGASITQEPGRDRTLELGANVSKIAAGAHTVQFRLRLQEIA